MHALIDSSLTSLHATLAPYLARASATPLPMFGPTPVTSATLPSRETSTDTAPFLLGSAVSDGPDPADYVTVQVARQSGGGTEDGSRRWGIRQRCWPERSP